jgi:hypothetical protein
MSEMREKNTPQRLKPASIFDVFMYGLKPVPFIEILVLD